MTKIGIVGNFGNWKYKGDGQTIKTVELYKFLKGVYKDINYVDMDKEVKVLTKIKSFFKTMKESENIIIILSYRGYSVMLPIICFFNMFYKKKIYDFVIGGSRYQVIAKNKLLYILQKKIKKIYVETKKLLEEYKKIGVNNCEVIPNFKEMKIAEQNTKIQNEKNMKVCTFTRVHKDKGIEDAIEGVKLANSKLGENIVRLDIYGVIDKDYKEEFEKMQKNMPDYVRYKGLVSQERILEVLTQYDIMLFLTFHVGEGFPGTVIDSFAAGLPIIATKWNSNEEIVEEGINGNLVEVHDIEKVSNLLIEYNKERKKIESMKSNCIRKSKDYLSKNALKSFIEEIDKESNE